MIPIPLGASKDWTSWSRGLSLSVASFVWRKGNLQIFCSVAKSKSHTWKTPVASSRAGTRTFSTRKH